MDWGKEYCYFLPKSDKWTETWTHCKLLFPIGAECNRLNASCL